MVTAEIKKKKVSGIFLQPNLKDLEYSLRTERLFGVGRSISSEQVKLLFSQQQKLIGLPS
jgi:hypothetical protein